jgi:hypothetical protein
MAWKKPDPAMVQRFNDALPAHPDAERKKMFGYPACFVKDNFFAGLHQDDVVVRLPGGIKDRFPELANSPIFDPRGTGTGMKDWYMIPPAVVEDAAKLTRFLAAAFEEVHQLPAKAPKKPKKANKAAGKKKAAS